MGGANPAECFSADTFPWRSPWYNSVRLGLPSLGRAIEGSSKMKLNLLAGAALAAVFAASGVSAQETGWYGAVDLGYHWPQSLKTESDAPVVDGVPAHWAWKSDSDWTGFVRLGYQFNPHWRAEVEGGYRPGDLKGVRG